MSGPVARARGLLARAGWIDVAAADGTYPLRVGGDRRTRTTMRLSEAEFLALVADPGLKARPGGGWIERPRVAEAPSPTPGAPGRIEGERAVMDADGLVTLRRANLGESPLAWLARRKDAEGRPFLSPAELAAGERLRSDAEIARAGPSLTMRWDALPRTGGGSSARMEPGDRSLAAGRRVARALAAVDPRHRPLLEQVCLRETSLQLAERHTGAARREGKTVLKAGLRMLAAHYGIG
ncbi:DUF6456 domain-containing protein [Brevundimonas sp. NIBR11]|uniref:DUF6456 domain-containing protein n=1 Tax=Brevundimonas sp. NIBR11 TaxID=3015999 RepID=UPI0022F015AB|nr:DUF6456 domain-containing protein [Brevundimonas sp. NIBR11]WGM30227.1 hypothetical protein KKHFBJBL_00443 [Brevundimonas sp. NIBR11]